jgi:porin
MRQRNLLAKALGWRPAIAVICCLTLLRASHADNPTTSDSEDTSSDFTGDWFGLRPKLAAKGITLDASYIADGTKNLKGGLDTAGSTWRRLLDVNFTLDTKPLFHIDGGTVDVEFENAQGPNASDELVGDIQGIDGLDGVPGAPHQNRTQISQLWYQQTAFDGKLRIKAGKIDANTEFDHSDTAQEFLHQSAGSSVTLFTLPTYPDPAIGFNLFLNPRDDIQIGFGVYDGSFANGTRTGELGTQPVFHNAGDLFLIGEIDKSWTLGPNQLTGRIAVGGWYSTNDFARLDGGKVSGTGGPYALLEQSLWRARPQDPNDPRGISLFLMYGYADPTILQLDYNIGGGVSWTGPLPNRPDDIVGIEAQAAHFSKDFHASSDFETSCEIFYRLQLQPWFYIKPDLQYISHPGGMGTPDALALTLRFQINF